MFADPVLNASFERDGYVIVDLFDADQVARLQRIWKDLEGGLRHYPFSATIMSSDETYRRSVHRAIDELARARLAELVPTYELLVCMFNNKRSTGASSVVGLHQDWTIVDETRYGSLGIFAPLTDVDETSGCLYVVAGTHRANVQPRTMRYVQPYPELESAFVEHQAAVPMRAGQACIHALTVFHSSAPNLSGQDRLATGLLMVEKGSALRYYKDCESGGMDALAVDRDFFFRLQYGVEPTGGTSLGRTPYHRAQLSRERLAAIVSGNRTQRVYQR